MIRSLLFFLFLGALAAYLFKMVLLLDFNKRVYNHRPGSCRQVEGIVHGSEDIALLEDEGIAILTSGVFFISPREKDVKGQMFLYDFAQNGTFKAEPLKINGKYDQENFHPHGITHIVTSTGTVRLFVISHTRAFEHSVMVFRQTRQLDLVKTIRDEKFIRPNDLVAVSEEAFILSNDGSAQTTVTNLIEYMSLIPSGSVVYYDGKLIPRTMSPNGVILDRDREHLIVSHLNDKILSVYKLGENYRSLSRVIDVPLLTAADNFYVDNDGAIWIGAHPVLHEALRHLTDCDDLSKYSPSQVIRIKFSKDFKSWEFTEPFMDDGRLISAASVAVRLKNQLLIGSICRQVVHCDITAETI
ncbi:hypothetical protein Y032_0012g1814 [Ancylostoma ceylanicum]|uniref:Arylesterase n=1 Tax=Ancylostoma ceylanicum TaxID=53326 RepID=A0A016VDF6_9BILA|nr:hypothetical protein Y032_0012g1814 [Ancylostoma ceylanicum]